MTAPDLMHAAAWLSLAVGAACAAADELWTRWRRRRAAAGRRGVLTRVLQQHLVNTPDPPPRLLTLANGGLVKGWTDEDEARWTTNAPATPPRS